MDKGKFRGSARNSAMHGKLWALVVTAVLVNVHANSGISNPFTCELKTDNGKIKLHYINLM